MTDNNQIKKGKLIYLGIFALCFFLAIAAWRIDSSSNLSPLLQDDHLSVLSVTGTISTDDGAGYNQQWLLDAVEEITYDDRNRGLLLYIDSPGGYVYQGDELYLKLMEYKALTGRPIYVSMGSYAASGGYYLACAGDQLFANRNTITGSLGIITATHIDLSKFLARYSITVTQVSSGRNKNMGSYYQPISEEQKAIYQGICDEYYQRFVDIIAASRQLTAEQVRLLADGRIYSASQAVNNGLIDGIATFDETLDKMAADLAVNRSATLYYSYEEPLSFLDSIMKASQNLQPTSMEEQLLQVIEETPEHQFMFYYAP